MLFGCCTYEMVKVLLAEWKVKTPCNANGIFINKINVKFKPEKKIKFISKSTIY